MLVGIFPLIQCARFFPPSSSNAHPYPSPPPRHLPTRASTDLSANNRDNVYVEVYNYLTSYLLGKAAILIHCPLNNRLSFLSKTRDDALGRPLHTA